MATTKKATAKKTTAKAKKVTPRTNVDKIVHIAKTVNGEIAATAETVNDKIMDTTQNVGKEIVKTAKTVNSQVWGVTKEVTEDVVKNTREWTSEQMKSTREWTNEQVKTVQDRFNINLEMPKVDLKKAVKETNDLALNTADSIIEGATKNGEKWQKVTAKAIKGGLQLAEKQQDIMFDTLEAVKGQLIESRKRTQALFSKN